MGQEVDCRALYGYGKTFWDPDHKDRLHGVVQNLTGGTGKHDNHSRDCGVAIP